MSAAVARFPRWVLLEPYVFRRDDDESFPDDIVAPIRASGTTSLGAKFRIAFSLVEPPMISRLYAQLPGFPGPDKQEPLDMLANHRNLFLLYICTDRPSDCVLQDFFIFRADVNNPSSSSLRALPPCTEPLYNDFRIRNLRRPSNATPHLLDIISMGLWCGGNEEFVVAELTPGVPTITGHGRPKAFADICLLRSSFADIQLGRRKWTTIRLPILCTTDDDLWKLSQWQTDAVIPFQRGLCWIDYHQGILVCDVDRVSPTISFLWFPASADKNPCRDSGNGNGVYFRVSADNTPCSGNGGVAVVENGCLLRFVNVDRHDGRPANRELKPGTGFTITCHTLLFGSSLDWKKDYTVTSDDLPDHLRRGLPMFPRVDIVRPQVVHFLFIEFGKAYKKMSVLSIDLSTKTVESFYPYMDGNEHLQTEYKPRPPTIDIDFIKSKSMCPIPRPFFPCQFPSF